MLSGSSSRPLWLKMLSAAEHIKVHIICNSRAAGRIHTNSGFWSRVVMVVWPLLSDNYCVAFQFFFFGTSVLFRTGENTGGDRLRVCSLLFNTLHLLTSKANNETHQSLKLKNIQAAKMRTFAVVFALALLMTMVSSFSMLKTSSFTVSWNDLSDEVQRIV